MSEDERCWLLLQLSLPVVDAPGLIAALREHSPRAQLLTMDDGSSRELIGRLLEAGTAGEGRAGSGRPEPEAGPAPDLDLSEREQQVIRRLAAGRTTRAIAHELVLAESTVKTYIHRVLDKLGAHTRAEAIARAARRGLLD